MIVSVRAARCSTTVAARSLYQNYSSFASHIALEIPQRSGAVPASPAAKLLGNAVDGGEVSHWGFLAFAIEDVVNSVSLMPLVSLTRGDGWWTGIAVVARHEGASVGLRSGKRENRSDPRHTVMLRHLRYIGLIVSHWSAPL